MRKIVVLAIEDLELEYRFRQALSCLDVEVLSSSCGKIKEVLSRRPAPHVIVYEVKSPVQDLSHHLDELLPQDASTTPLFIVEEDVLGEFNLPLTIKSDFIVRGASVREYCARIRQMLRIGSDQATSDILVVDGMTINLATYQVTVGRDPLDLTYLEYALLAFLVTNKGCTYSRDALLQRVWGFDYGGGSRTVDVHVRRVRAKLGPELAQYLETIRGVGYLWNA